MITANRYRDKTVIKDLALAIGDESPARPLKIMHVCGTHENTISRYGLRELLPEDVEVIAGPGVIPRYSK